MSQIIGFTGKLGSGKDTAADRLVGMLAPGTTVQRGSFARKLKQSAAACFPDVTIADWEVWKNDPLIKVLIVREAPGDFELQEYGGEEKVYADIISEQTVRSLLQLYGTEAHRQVFGDNFWVEQAFANLGDYDLLLFTDARFENEALSIRERGGWIVRVTGANEETGAHASEAGFDESLIDFEIDNTIRDDSYVWLDRELALLAQKLLLPTRMAA